MSKIHITLVGGQPSPVYNGILSTMPEKVIFVCSEDSKDVAIRIQNEIQLESDIIYISPSDMLEISNTVSDLYNKYKEDDLSLNLTGGAKLWMLLSYKVFIKNELAYLFYIDQNNLEWNLRSAVNKKISFNPNKLFELQGTPLRHYRPISLYNEEDDSMIPLIESARKFNPGAFNYLFTTLNFDFKQRLSEKESDTFIAQNGSWAEWNKESEEVEVHLMTRYNTWHQTLSSPNIIKLIFNAGWFEYKVASLFKERYKDIRLNCLFESENEQTKNEVDIIINTGTKLLFVECKTKLSKITDIDKFHSVVKNYGGMGSKALFITDFPMEPVSLEKCKDNDVLAFSLQGRTNAKKDLYTLLDIELNRINKK